MSVRGPLVDTHVHVNGRYQPLADWLAGRQALPTDGAVLVQQLNRFDNYDLVAAVRDSGGRFAGIGAVQRASDVEGLMVDGGLRGLRLPPSASGECAEIWAELDRVGGVASVTGPFDSVIGSEFAEVMRRHDRIHFRLEHLAWLRTGEMWSDPVQRSTAIAGFRELAANPRTSLMWSGFFHNSGDSAPYRNSHPVLELTLELFGSERITWSGDWNRAGLQPGEHAQARDLVAALPFLDEPARLDVLGRSAVRIFGLQAEPLGNAR